jgi:hypothetical protein
MVKLSSFSLLFALSAACGARSFSFATHQATTRCTTSSSVTTSLSQFSSPSTDPGTFSKRAKLHSYLDSSISRLRGGGLLSPSSSSSSSNSNSGEVKSTATDSSSPKGSNLKLLQGQTYMFSGSLLPTIRQIISGGGGAYARGWKAVKQFHHVGDIAVLAVVSLTPMYIFQAYHYLFYKLATKIGKQEKSYEDSRLSSIGRIICQMGQVASVVYAVETMTTFLIGVLGAPVAEPARKAAAVTAHAKSVAFLQKFPELFANAAYGVWITRKILRVKSRLLNKFMTRLPDPETYDTLLNFLISLVATIFVLDASSFDLGSLVTSLVAVGGLSSIVVGLALKEPGKYRIICRTLVVIQMIRPYYNITLKRVFLIFSNSIVVGSSFDGGKQVPSQRKHSTWRRNTRKGRRNWPSGDYTCWW